MLPYSVTLVLPYSVTLYTYTYSVTLVLPYSVTLYLNHNTIKHTHVLDVLKVVRLVLYPPT